MSIETDIPEPLLALFAEDIRLRSLLARETSETPPTYVGLLGFMAGEKGEYDPLVTVGLGLGTSRRARELIIKGLLLENEAALKNEIASMRRRPGRPASEITADVRRAEVVLRLKNGIGRECRKPNDLIGLAIQVEEILLRHGELTVEERLFDPVMVTWERLQSSVSTGLRRLGYSAKKLFRENPPEYSKNEA